MKILNYHINYDHIEDLYTVTAETDNGKPSVTHFQICIL
ncbi:hypothetical protein ACUXDX_000843 [Staphylococcus epidermidis]